MFRLIENVLSAQQLTRLREIAASAQFVDGKVSNPHSRSKNNLQLHDQQAGQEAAQIMAGALVGNEDFRNFAFPAQLAPPMLTRYEPKMNYGLHPDAAVLTVGNATLRTDLSCTVFVAPPESYEGGALRIQLGTQDIAIKGPAGSAIVYPSNTLHEVLPVSSGERLVGITFIQSQVRDSAQRELLYELNEVAALEGNRMGHDNFVRLQAVQQNLKRMWALG